jgi:Plavaka transposase
VLSSYSHILAVKLPDSFKDFAVKHFGGKGPSADFMAHCHRELYHAQWKVLLDDEFVEACKHGIVICCCDGVERRFYPQIFTYSADYPEK